MQENVDNEVKRLQSRELEILKAIAELFEKNNIDFWLAYGTTLGCVRHNGFIPWDDDVDIFIKGEDYARVVKIFEEQDTGNLALHDFNTAEGYPYIFPKIIDKSTKLKEKEYEDNEYVGGVYVDLFLLFELPNNKLIRRIKEKIRYIRYAKIRGYYKNLKNISGLKALFVKLLKKTVNCKRVQKKLYKGYTKPFKNNKRFLIEPNVFCEKNLIKSEYFKGKDIAPFEGCNMPIPLNVDSYLTDTYGDYMRLPDEKDRVPCHDFALLEM